jgi:hypothetical protein
MSTIAPAAGLVVGNLAKNLFSICECQTTPNIMH